MSLYKRKDTGVWWMSLKVAGKRNRISTGTKNRKKAELIHAKVLSDVQDGQWFEKRIAAEVRFSDLADKYMSKYQKLRDPTSLQHLLPYFGDMTLSEITAETVEDYVISRAESSKNPAAATVYQEFSLGRRMFNVARKRWKWTSKNPFTDVEFAELLIIDNGRDRWLSAEEESILMGYATPNYLKDIIIFALHTGCRRGEILTITWKKNVDMKRRLLTIQASKNGNLKTIPMSNTLYKLMLKLSRVVDISGKVFPVTVAACKDSFKRAVKKSAIENIRFHDLRHTFATRLVQNGIDVYRVKELMGHRSIKTTERYAHHCPESLRTAVSVLDVCHDFVTVKGAKQNVSVDSPAENAVKSVSNTIGSV